MGCASSKKRTTSIEDLQGGGPSANKEPLINKSKNGQVSSNDTKSTPPILRETVGTQKAAPPQPTSDAIQIPGAHKSFLAPDGIPFIDEDVDDDDDDVVKTGGSGDPAGIPDVNKNVVTEPSANHKQPAPAAPATVAPVVIDDVKPPTVVVAGQERTVDTPAADPTPEAPQEQPSEDAAFTAALDVLSKDLDIQREHVFAVNGTKKKVRRESSVSVGLNSQGYNSQETQTFTSVTTEETTVVTTSAESEQVEPSVSDEQQLAAAAVKIQAGIRGYRDRQKVKAIRAAQLSPTDEPETVVQHEEVSVSIVADGEEHHAAELDAEHHDESKLETQPQEQSADAQDQEGIQNIDERHAGDKVESEDVDDPEKERAAVKIQANYKGWKTRKEVGKVKK